MEFTNLPPLDNKRRLLSNYDLFVDFTSTNFLSKMITVSFLKWGITNNLDGSQVELVYNSTENTNELDDSFIKNLQVFASDSETEFEGFVV